MGKDINMMKKIILLIILALATLTTTAQDKLFRVADKLTSSRTARCYPSPLRVLIVTKF